MTCEERHEEALARLDAVLRDLASLRLRLEEVLDRRSEAPRLTPEEEEKAEKEAAERERQREEAFLRMRAEEGRGEEVDEADRVVISELWLLK